MGYRRVASAGEPMSYFALQAIAERGIKGNNEISTCGCGHGRSRRHRRSSFRQCRSNQMKMLRNACAPLNSRIAVRLRLRRTQGSAETSAFNRWKQVILRRESRPWSKKNARRLLGQVSRCAIALVSIFRYQADNIRQQVLI